MTTTVVGTVSFSIPTPPTAASVAAALAATPSFVAAVAAALGTVAPPVTPPVVPPATGANQVVANGKNLWTGNMNYGGAQETDNVTGPDGQPAILITATTPMGADGHAGGGGFQPYYENPPNTNNVFNTTGLAFLNMTLAPTRAGQQWSSGFEGANDTPVPGAVPIEVETFGPAPVVGKYATYKIPLGAIAGAMILKFNLQDQMTWGTMPQNALGNQYYIKDIHFSAT
jgi:hypothetical protein